MKGMEKMTKKEIEKMENNNPIIRMLKAEPNCKYSGKNRWEFVKERMQAAAESMYGKPR